MTRYIEMGEDLKLDQKIRFSFYCPLDKNFSPSQLIFTDELVECSDT